MGTTTAPPCGHGLCAACEYALSKRRKPGRPKCPRCRAPEQSESALILEDEVPLLRARHAAVVRTDAAEARRLLSRAAERCRAAQAWEAAAARRDAGLEGRRSSRRHAVLADLELGEALLGLGDFDGRPPRVIFCALFWVTTPNRRTRDGAGAATALGRGLPLAEAGAPGELPAATATLWTGLARAQLEIGDAAQIPRRMFLFPFARRRAGRAGGRAHSAARATARADAPWQAHHTLGAAQDRLGEPRAATAAYRAALAKVGARDAERATVLFNLGRCCRASGDLGDAVKCLRECLAASPEDGAAARELAVALEAAGDSEAAVATLRKYLVRSPADPRPRGLSARFFLARRPPRGEGSLLRPRAQSPGRRRRARPPRTRPRAPRRRARGRDPLAPRAGARPGVRRGAREPCRRRIHRHRGTLMPILKLGRHCGSMLELGLPAMSTMVHLPVPRRAPSAINRAKYPQRLSYALLYGRK